MPQDSENSATEQPASASPVKAIRRHRGGPGRPFQPGQSGNPGGKPRGLAALVRDRTNQGLSLIEYMERVKDGKEVLIPDGGLTVREQIELAKLRSDAVKWLTERGWGAPQQYIEHTGPEGEGLSITIDLGGGK